MDKRIIKPYVEKYFSTEVLPSLMNFIRIPNCSPNYDPDWEKNGNALVAAEFLRDWVDNQALKGCKCNIVKEDGHTPLIYIDVPSTNINDKRTILMYSHYDKQPAFTGWSPDLGPQKPVIKNGYLYGRGSSDDGYALFAAVTAIKTCQDNSWPLPRIVIITEGSEESNIEDLSFYTNKLKDVIGTPSLVICLDSGCQDYKRLWISTNLRGAIAMDLKVTVLDSEVHSGLGGGLVPDSFMVIRQLLDRLEDENTGIITDQNLNVVLPDNRSKEIDEVVEIVKDQYLSYFPWIAGTKPLANGSTNLVRDCIIKNTWKPTLTITGASGFPEVSTSGNIMRTFSDLRLSFRLPPGIVSQTAMNYVKTLIESNPPYNAQVVVTPKSTGDGWNLKSENFSDRIKNILNMSSMKFFDNNPSAYFGIGGSIPFVQMFNNLFPTSDFAVLGLAGPGSNIHGPDENLDLEYCKKLIMSLTFILSAY